MIFLSFCRTLFILSQYFTSSGFCLLIRNSYRSVDIWGGLRNMRWHWCPLWDVWHYTRNWWREGLVSSRERWKFNCIWSWFWWFDGPLLGKNRVFSFIFRGVIFFIGVSIRLGQSLTTDIWVFFSSPRGRWVTLCLQSFILLIFGNCWSTMTVPNKEKWQKQFT
jgi:hypothetical protein